MTATLPVSIGTYPAVIARLLAMTATLPVSISTLPGGDRQTAGDDCLNAADRRRQRE